MGTSGGYSVYDDRATFNTAVAEFVQDGENARFESDVVFNDDGTILVSLITNHSHSSGVHKVSCSVD